MLTIKWDFLIAGTNCFLEHIRNCLSNESHRRSREIPLMKMSLRASCAENHLVTTVHHGPASPVRPFVWCSGWSTGCGHLLGTSHRFLPLWCCPIGQAARRPTALQEHEENQNFRQPWVPTPTRHEQFLCGDWACSLDSWSLCLQMMIAVTLYCALTKCQTMH